MLVFLNPPTLRSLARSLTSPMLLPVAARRSPFVIAPKLAIRFATDAAKRFSPPRLETTSL